MRAVGVHAVGCVRASARETGAECWRRGRLTGELLSTMRLFMASHRHKDGMLTWLMCEMCLVLAAVLEREWEVRWPERGWAGGAGGSADCCRVGCRLRLRLWACGVGRLLCGAAQSIASEVMALAMSKGLRDNTSLVVFKIDAAGAATRSY